MQGGEFVIQNTLQWPTDSSPATCVTGTSTSAPERTTVPSSCGATETSIGYGKGVVAGSIAGSVVGGFMLGVLAMLTFNMVQKTKNVESEYTDSNNNDNDSTEVVDGGRLGS
jgi:hypothetical protein